MRHCLNYTSSCVTFSVYNNASCTVTQMTVLQLQLRRCPCLLFVLPDYMIGNIEGEKKWK